MAQARDGDQESWFWERSRVLVGHQAFLTTTSPHAQSFVQAVKAQNMDAATEEASYLLLQPDLQDIIIHTFRPGE